jgi:hypothetical protein
MACATTSTHAATRAIDEVAAIWFRLPDARRMLSAEVAVGPHRPRFPLQLDHSACGFAPDAAVEHKSTVNRGSSANSLLLLHSRLSKTTPARTIALIVAARS